MQPNAWLIPDPPPLPGPGLFDRLFLEQPWWLAVLFWSSGVVVFVVLNRRGHLRGAISIFMSLLVLGFCIISAAGWIVTDREAIMGRSVELVREVAAADAVKAGDVLDHDAKLSAFIFSEPIDRNAILAHVGSDFAAGGPYRVKEYGVQEMQATLDGPDVGRSQIKVRVVPEASGVPVLSWWTIHWRRTGGSWRAVRIEPIAISGVKDARGK